ncbi:phosphatase PAP2 family protein [Sphingomonas sp. SM33]|uniref:Acid phosphatase n=1 Tax=Sphingomonas telluris TaxID=2907998 RepID=A0ABS9VNF6_9SPHN|nr:phosphatase PAP2 family protein [Sphingomonas telluris]MCH8616507.1 phosphatase PAP2 family protein [Sphingomonas telluris]
MTRMRRIAIIPAAFIGLAAGLSLAQTPPAAMPANPRMADPRKLPPSYLPREALPDSLALLPPPPGKGSAAMQRDEEARKAAARLKGSARYQLATEDAVIGFPEIPNDFACAMGFSINKGARPRLYGLLARMLIDVGLSTYGAKDHYKRTRPFVAHHEGTCYPKDEALLRQDGSYPSGHSAIGWGFALVLAELNPSHADAILQRGREFGQSRLVCDAHWQSDIDAGRVIAAATVARLHADPAFRTDLEAARAEVTAALSKPAPANDQCAAEASALAASNAH